MWTLKSENRVSFTVRLNLNKPRHREAWNRLRSGSGSYTASVVNALTREANPTVVFPDAAALKAIVRQAVTEALDGLPDYKMHCSVLAEEAIRSALDDYYSRKNENHG